MQGFETRLPIVCWIFTNAVVPIHGTGLRRVSLIQTQGCPRRSSWRAGAAKTRGWWHWYRVAGMAASVQSSGRQRNLCADRFERVLQEGRKRPASINNRSKPVRRFRLPRGLRLTGHANWLEEAHRIFQWFLGKNDLQAPLYDPNGGCKEGLHPDRVNENQGAESTLSFLMALLEMQGVQETSAENCITK